MIDPADKLTQALPLDEQPAKRKRGRPATGKAMTPAEKQRAYRERQKAQRYEKSDKHAVPYEEVVAIALELGERCKRAEDRRDELHDQVQRLQAVRDDLIRELRETKKELAQRNENNQEGGPEPKAENLPGVWIVERKSRGARTWKPCGNPETNLKDARDAVDYMQFKSGSGQAEEWRALRADGLIYWPLWTKAKAPK